MKFKNIELPVNPQEEDLKDLQVHFANHINELAEEFALFNQRAIVLLELTANIFSKKLDTDPVSLQQDLLDTMAVYYSLGQYTADAKTFNQIYEMLHYCPKKSKYSEADRKRYTSTKTIGQNNLLALLQNGEEKIEKRVTVIQSVLKAETARIQKDNIT